MLLDALVYMGLSIRAGKKGALLVTFYQLYFSSAALLNWSRYLIPLRLFGPLPVACMVKGGLLRVK